MAVGELKAHQRFSNYDKSHSWQYEIRIQNQQEDLRIANLTEEESLNLSIADFNFFYVSKDDQLGCQEIKAFIERHEWLGKMPMAVTHRFTARLKGSNLLAGVIVMATPNTFSFLLGEEGKNLEKLIARGACISWSPKNLGSWLIMKSIKWMVANTEFRYFTAYSDPEAKELGTIYQACNFIYLGQKFGGGYQYLDPKNTERGWFGESGFSDRSQIVRYAKSVGLEWQDEWYRRVGAKKNYRKINWDTIPPLWGYLLKQERNKHKNSCQKRRSPAKHKYCYILGETKRETKHLQQLFNLHNPEKNNLPYPQIRGE
jgi:hypothetical protein